MLWPGVIVFSAEHFDGLMQGAAVPLDMRAVLWLSKNGGSLAIDVYWWLAQRLRYINEPNGVPIGWQALKEQFGQDYRNLADFRKEFKRALDRVVKVYPEARIDKLKHGIRLMNSKAAIPPKQLA